MTIQRDGGTIHFCCDNCGDSLDTEESDEFFGEAIKYAKLKGWQFFKANGEWEHYCADCKRAAA
jgi:hypothetical protein